MKDFKINRILINDNTAIEPVRINIIVGPNSSGKSRFLKDLRQLLNNNYYSHNDDTIVVKDIDFDLPNNLNEFIEKYNLEERIINTVNGTSIRNYYGSNLTSMDSSSSLDNYMINNNINISRDWRKELEKDFSVLSEKNELANILLECGIPKEATEVEVINQELIRYKQEEKVVERVIGGSSGPGQRDVQREKNNFLSKYGTLFFQYLGTEEKLLMCKRQKRFGIESNSLNLLSESQLHIEDVIELSAITKELFGKYIYLDRNSYGDSLAFRVSEDFDFYSEIEINNSKYESKVLKYPLLDEEGDGIKNFVSTYLTIKSMNKRLIMIDEPESFLHPPLARRFGEILSKLIKSDQQLFVVTHSEDIINGIISKTPSTQFNIIRMERKKETNKIYILPQKDRLELKKSPIMLMSNILKGFFSEKVYITESFSDSALYQSLMIKYNDYSSFYFVNTEGKDKIGQVIKYYDIMGVPNVAIYDFDYFRDENTIRNSLIKKLGATKDYQIIYDNLKNAREYIENLSKEKAIESIANLENLSKKEKKDEIDKIRDDLYHAHGVNCIKNKTIKEELNSTLESLKLLGIYVLKTGTLETVLKSVGYEQSNNKSTWIDGALEYIDTLSKEEINKLAIRDLISGKV